MYCGAVHRLLFRAAAARGGGRGFRPRATDFWHSPKVSKRLLRCPLRRALAPFRGHSPYSLPPKNPRTRRSFGRLVRRFTAQLRTRRRWLSLSGWYLESVPPVFSLAVGVRCRSAKLATTCPRNLMVVALFVVQQMPPYLIAVVGAHIVRPFCRRPPRWGRTGARCVPLHLFP